MKTPRNQIAPVIARLTQKSGISVQRLSHELAAYLLDENRTGELDSLMRDIIAYRAEHSGIIEIEVVSAHELSETTRRDIEKMVRDQFPDVAHIIVDQRIDLDMIGGVRLELVDRQLDLTVRGKLNRFKELTTVERTA